MNDEDREKQFDVMVQDYVAAFNRGDVEAVVAAYTEDVVHCPPMGEELRGHDALRGFYRHTFSEMRAQLSDYEYEVCFAADHAFVRESWTVTMNPLEGTPFSVSGRGMWIARQEEDGEWRAFWVLARSDSPLPQP